MGMQKGICKSPTPSSREKYITWTDEATEFMLEWFIQTRKDKPDIFKWKKQHHHQCAQALNEKFGLGVTRNQVNRHFRSYKEKWNWIRFALAKSGYGFDSTICKFNIDPSEKDLKKHGPTKYNYLTKPIKFFHLLEELFGESVKANGSFAVDLSTVNDTHESDDGGSGQDLEQYVWTFEDDGNDSDTIPRNSPTIEGTSPSQKRKYFKSPSKKPSKDKSSRKRASNDQVVASIIKLANHLASGNHGPPPPPPQDPNTILWKCIQDLTVTNKDKLEIAEFLTKPEQEYLRSYLRFVDEATFEEWVLEFFDCKYRSSGACKTL